MKKILFHIAVGNKDRPGRWTFVNRLFSNLARSLEKIGKYDMMFWVHPKAVVPEMYKNNKISLEVTDINFNPDYVFTWNGISEGDQKVIKKYGKEKMIYGELGFLDHYKSVYFNSTGVNCKNSLIIENNLDFNETDFELLKSKYIKPRLFKDPYIFVPLQDETDTQIIKYSPFKTMDELLEYVETLYCKSNIKILYKKHPMKPCKINPRKNFIEVKENVHHYLPYAELVIGINSSVLFETLLYHNRILTTGLGITSRYFTDTSRKSIIMAAYNSQFKWDDLKNVNKIKDSYIVKQLLI